MREKKWNHTGSTLRNRVPSNPNFNSDVGRSLSACVESWAHSLVLSPTMCLIHPDLVSYPVYTIPISHLNLKNILVKVCNTTNVLCTQSLATEYIVYSVAYLYSFRPERLVVWDPDLVLLIILSPFSCLLLCPESKFCTSLYSGQTCHAFIEFVM